MKDKKLQLIIYLKLLYIFIRGTKKYCKSYNINKKKDN